MEEQLFIEISPSWCVANGLNYEALLAVIMDETPLRPNERD